MLIFLWIYAGWVFIDWCIQEEWVFPWLSWVLVQGLGAASWCIIMLCKLIKIYVYIMCVCVALFDVAIYWCI